MADFTALGFSEETSSKVSSILGSFYDFTACQRPNGTVYGTGGKCRKGVEVNPKQETPKEKKAPKTKEATISSPVPTKDLEEMKTNLQRIGGWNDDREKAFSRITGAQSTKELGQIIRKLEKEHFDNDEHPGLSAGFIKNAKKAMKEWLEANQRSGIGAAAAKRREEMTPEERRRAMSAERIQRGVRAGVVNPRMR